MTESAADYQLDSEDFGDEIGVVSLYQLSLKSFHHECLSASSSAQHVGSEDSTGKRLYAGAHVAVRFFAKLKGLIFDRRVIEIGCGTGIVGALIAKLCQSKRMVLTDGNPDTLVGTHLNAHHISDKSGNISVDQLCWSTDDFTAPSQQIRGIFTAHNDSQPFDIVLGCELMYFSTDISELLLTVLQLTRGRGIFLHCHLFRRSGQIDEWINICAEHHWTTLELLHEDCISASDLRHHPEWYKMRALMSGPTDLVQRAMDAPGLEHLHFVPFTEEGFDNYYDVKSSMLQPHSEQEDMDCESQIRFLYS